MQFLAEFLGVSSVAVVVVAVVVVVVMMVVVVMVVLVRHVVVCASEGYRKEVLLLLLWVMLLSRRVQLADWPNLNTKKEKVVAQHPRLSLTLLLVQTRECARGVGQLLTPN